MYHFIANNGIMNKTIYTMLSIIATTASANSQTMDNPNTNTTLAPIQQLQLTQEWDKTFPKSNKVDHHKVTFVNRYGITLAERCCRTIAGNSHQRSVWSCKRAILRTLRPAACRARVPDNRFRPFVYRRERRHASPCGFTRHQYRGFLRSRRFSVGSA